VTHCLPNLERFVEWDGRAGEGTPGTTGATSGARRQGEVTMLWTIIIVLLLLAAVGGGVGYSRWGYGVFSPVLIIVVVGAVLYFTGHLRLG
jgi:hypothetical protein